MKIDWNKIRYIMQIPAQWYKDIQDKIYHSYGTSFIRVKHDGMYNGLQIGIDTEEFKKTIERVSGGVKSVDNVGPDENGNVVLNAIQTSDVGDVGIIAGLDYEGEYSVAPMAHGHRLSDIVDQPVPIGGNIVFSVDGVKADALSGNVQLGAVRGVRTEDGTIIRPDLSGILDIELSATGGVKTVNLIEPDENGNVDLGEIVYSVNGTAPDSDGNVQLEIEASQIVGIENYPTKNQVTTEIDNRLSNITHDDISDWDTATFEFLKSEDVCSPGEIVGLNYQSDYSVANPNHGHYASDIVDLSSTLSGDFVTVNTDQTITGKKTFTETVDVGDRTTIRDGDIEVRGDLPMIDLYNADGSFRIEKSRSGVNMTLQSGIVDNASITLSLVEARIRMNSQIGTIFLDAAPDRAKLTNHPTEYDKTSTSIATVGYVQTYLGTYVKTVNNIAPDANGNVDVEAGEGSVKSVDNISPDSSGNINLDAVVTTKVETAGQIVGLDYSSERYVCNVNHGHTSDDILDWDDATSSFVKKVDGHSPNASGEVSFGLTASKFVKTDANGHLTTTNDKVITVGSSDSPVNGTYTVVKSVTWTSPNIVIARDQWKFVNGVLVSVTALANTTIGTTVYTGT